MSREGSGPRFASVLGHALGTGLGVLVAARLSYALAVSGIVVVWFPSGLLLSILLARDRRLWPAIASGAYVANALVDSAVVGLAGFALTAPAANVAEGLLAAVLIRRFAPHADLSRSLRGTVALLGAATLSNAVTALLGAAVLVYWFGESTFWRYWLMWWLGDALGMVLVAPGTLAAVGAVERRRSGTVSPPRLLETALLIGLVLLAANVVFGREPEAGHALSSTLSILLLLIWAALRLGPLVPAVATGLLAIVTLWHSGARRGPLVGPEQGSLENAVQVFAFLAVASLSVLVLSAVIAEKQSAADRVRGSESRYRAVVDAARDAIVTVDAEGRVLFCNAAAERLVGRPSQELRGRSAFEALPEEIRAGAATAFERYVSGGEGPRRMPIAVSVLHRDGHRVPTELVFGEWREHGERRFTAVLRDVSERARIEAHLRRRQKLEGLGELTASVAHEFRNQLLVLQASLDLALLEAEGGSAELRSALDEIGSAIGRSTGTVQGLLAFGRRQPLRPVPTDLDELVAGEVSTVRPLLGASIRIDLEPSGSPKRVRVDPAALRQSLLNLLLNARDAMPRGGRVRIASAIAAVGEELGRRLSLPVGATFASLEVADDGSGIEPEALGQIFEPFFSTKRAGTGLGLAAVYGTVRQSGGAIEVESEPGVGTRFRIYLPSAED